MVLLGLVYILHFLPSLNHFNLKVVHCILNLLSQLVIHLMQIRELDILTHDAFLHIFESLNVISSHFFWLWWEGDYFFSLWLLLVWTTLATQVIPLVNL